MKIKEKREKGHNFNFALLLSLKKRQTRTKNIQILINNAKSPYHSCLQQGINFSF